jgi:hypothetical protein
MFVRQAASLSPFIHLRPRFPDVGQAASLSPSIHLRPRFPDVGQASNLSPQFELDLIGDSFQASTSWQLVGPFLVLMMHGREAGRCDTGGECLMAPCVCFNEPSLIGGGRVGSKRKLFGRLRNRRAPNLPIGAKATRESFGSLCI